MTAFRVTAPHFEARVGFARRTCRTAESPLRFFHGWSVAKVRHYCFRHGWRIVMLAAWLSASSLSIAAQPPITVVLPNGQTIKADGVDYATATLTLRIAANGIMRDSYE